MRKATKIWLIVAASLMLAGLVTLLVAVAALKWDFKEFIIQEKYEMNEYQITDPFEGISIVSDTADISFVPSEDSTVTVSCHEKTRLSHSVKVANGILMIDTVDTRKWYDHIQFFGSGTQKIIVQLPKGVYTSLSINEHTGDVDIPDGFLFSSVDMRLSTGDVSYRAWASETVKIHTTTGKIHLDGIHAGALDLSVTTGNIIASSVTVTGDVSIRVSTGKATLSEVSCQNLYSDGSTGDLSLTNVIATGRFSLKRSTGDVTLEACDAAEIDITTDTGDVKGTLLTEKIFIYKTDTGDVSLPESTAGGPCRITTDTGDIRLSVK